MQQGKADAAWPCECEHGKPCRSATPYEKQHSPVHVGIDTHHMPLIPNVSGTVHSLRTAAIHNAECTARTCTNRALSSTREWSYLQRHTMEARSSVNGTNWAGWLVGRMQQECTSQAAM